MENKQYVIIIAICLIGLGMIIGLAIGHSNQPEPEQTFIIYDYALTEKEVFERYEKYLNDKWYFTLEVDEYEISKEKVIEIIEEWFETVQINITVDDNDLSDITTDIGNVLIWDGEYWEERSKNN